jgi:HUS1 checkpoint protein
MTGSGGITGGDSGLQVWSQIKAAQLFEEYRIQSNANNEITLILAPEALAGALRSVAGGNAPSTHPTGMVPLDAPEVTLRLAKKNDVAVLAFETNTQIRTGRRVEVSHDVRVEVLKPADVARLAEPLCPEPDVRRVLACISSYTSPIILVS